MKFQSNIEALISKYDKFRPFPSTVRLSESKNVVDIERFIEITCKQSLEGSNRALEELKQFENALLQLQQKPEQ